jgi:hypothetical protein
MISGMDFLFFPTGVSASEKVGFLKAWGRSKIMKLQLLTGLPTNKTRILDQTTQELYIPGHSDVISRLGALCTPGWGSKSKEKRLFTEGNLLCG